MAEYFYLEPLGLGGAEVENIHSYFGRLAKLHSLTSYSFFKHLSHWWVRKCHERPLSRSVLHDQRGILCGVGGAIVDFQNALTIATGCDFVACTTMTSLVPAVSGRSGSPGRKGRAWCDACFLEDERSGGVCYDRLLWTLDVVSRCPFHKILLSQTCPSCGSSQEAYDCGSDITICWKCHKRIMRSKKEWVAEIKPVFGEKDCLDLVGAIGKGDLKNVKVNAFQVFLLEIYEHLSSKKTLRFLAEMMSLPTHDSHILLREKFSFVHMLRISSSSGVSLVDILQDPRSAAKQAGDLIGNKVAARTFSRRYLGSDELRKIERRLEEEFSKPPHKEIISFNALARELDVDVHRIYYHFPQLRSRYVKRRKMWLYMSSNSRERVLRRRLDYMLPSYPNGKYRTIKDLESGLMEICGVGRRVASHAVEKAIDKIRKKERLLQ